MSTERASRNLATASSLRGIESGERKPRKRRPTRCRADHGVGSRAVRHADVLLNHALRKAEHTERSRDEEHIECLQMEQRNAAAQAHLQREDGKMGNLGFASDEKSICAPPMRKQDGRRGVACAGKTCHPVSYYTDHDPLSTAAQTHDQNLMHAE